MKIDKEGITKIQRRTSKARPKKDSGVTLVILVIIIIILLILAAISMSTVVGENGILTRTKGAKKESERVALEEELQVEYVKQLEYNVGELEEFYTYLKEQGYDNVSKGDGEEEGRYFIEKDGTEYEIYKDEDMVYLEEVGSSLAPRITGIVITDKTTNSITFKVSVVRLDGGTLKYSYKNVSDENYSETKEIDADTEYTIYNLTTGQTYEIEAEAKNEYGLSTKSKTVATEDITSGTISMDATPTALTGGNVTVTIDYPSIAGAIKQYSTNGSTWSTYESEITVTENRTVYARLIDNTEQKSETKSITITNIDKLVPNPFNLSTSITTNSLTISGSTTDAAATTAYAFSGISKYQYKIDSGSWQDSNVFNNLTQGSSHTVYMKAIDKVGNEKLATNNGSTVTVGTIDEAISLAGAITITATPTAWTNGNVTATITYPTVTGMTKQYSTNGSTWSTYSSAITVSTNSTVYARMIDSTSQASTTKSLTISNIDKLTPNTFNLSTTTTTNSITVSGSTTDMAATTTNGCSGIAKYQYKIDSGSWQDSSTFSSLTQGSSHTIYMKAIDNAGNETNATNTGLTVTVGTIDNAISAVGAITITATPTAWTNGNVTVTISYPTVTGMTKQYSTNGSTWSTYSSAITVSTNSTVYARMIDSTSQTSTTKSLTISNIEKTAPTVSTSADNTTLLNSHAGTITLQDTQSGLPASLTISYAWSTSSTTAPTSWSTTTMTGTTGRTTASSVSVTCSGLTGTYYLWVKSGITDVAGNATSANYVSSSVVFNLESVAPTVSTSVDNTTSSKSHTGTITLQDTQSGLPASTSISYEWSTSSTTAPTSWSTTTMTGTAGRTTASSVSVTCSGLTGTYYLWVKSGIADVAGNATSVNYVSSSVVFNMDNTAPTGTIVLSSTNISKYNSLTATVTHADSNSGVNITSSKWILNTKSTSVGTTASSYTGGTFSSNPQTITLSNSTAGTYYLHVLTTDNAGNVKETVSSAITIFDPVAKIGTTYYETLQNAIDACSTSAGSTQTTITMIKSISLTTTNTVSSGQNIKIDLAGYTIACTGSAVYTITNNGTLEISGTGSVTSTFRPIYNGGTLKASGGTISSTGSMCVYNSGGIEVNGATMTVSAGTAIYNTNSSSTVKVISGTVKVTGSGDAIQVFTGTAEISGGTIESTARGIITSGSSSGGNVIVTGGIISGTTSGVANNNVGGMITITGGTITSSSSYGVWNNSGTTTIKGGTISGKYAVRNESGTITVGTDDGTVSTTSPVITGSEYGVYRYSGTVNFYDGIISGSSSYGSIYGTVANVPNGYEIAKTTSDSVESAILIQVLGYSNINGIVGVDGVTANTTFSRSYGKIDVAFLSGTSNTVSSTANTPKVAAGMIPIKWNGSNWVITNTSDSEWYSYVAQDSTTESGGTSKWANVMLSDGTYTASNVGQVVAESDLGSMFVWIPRYKYKITYYNTNANKITACKAERSTDYTNYRVHPTFDTDLNQGGWNTKLSGIWVAKFEASNSSDKIKVVPNVASWRGITIGNIYTNCINMLTTNASTYGVTTGTIDSHMMKNSEWGAVAYLTESIYGRNGTEVTINNNSNYITGIAGDTISAGISTSITNTYNTTKGQLASTTGNIYGIYDMSGGASEYVVSYIANGSSSLSTYGSSFAYSTAEENPTTRSTKYATAYGYNLSSDTSANNYAKNTEKYGDAIYETSTAGTGANSWNSDSSGFPNTGIPYFLRGGRLQ